MPKESEPGASLLAALSILVDQRGDAHATRSAAKTLLTIVGELARRPLRVGGGRLVRVRPADADDLVAKVVLKLLERDLAHLLDGWRAEFAGHDPRRLESYARSYVGRMLSNLAIDEHRRTRRVVLDDVLVADVAELPLDPGASLEPLEADPRPLLGGLVEAAASARPARHRDDLRRAWQQLSQLVFEGRTMDDVLEDERTRTGRLDEPPARTRARVLQAHRRLRDAMLATIEARLEAGTLGTADAAIARRAHDELLFRCHRSRPPT